MKKLLIGISSPINSTIRQVIATIAEEFCLEHISMRQPLINMVATLSNLNPTHQEFLCSPHATVEGLGITISELEVALGFSLRTIKSDFFIQRTQESIDISNSGLNGELFSGHIISGIRTEEEAQWLRDQGGLLVHLYHYQNGVKLHALDEIDGDAVAIISHDHPTKNNLAATLDTIHSRTTHAKKAA